MKVLMCHNYYQQPGGEDESFAQESRLLESHGHEVIRYTKHNDNIHNMSSLEVVARSLWNKATASELREIIRREMPDVMHCTNTFPLISPAAYYTARKLGVAVVQSLRNFRLLCPGAYLMRDGAPCEVCLGASIPWRAIQHRCYRNSVGASAAVALLNGAHRAIGTWTRAVDRYFALTDFARNKFIQGGLPAEKIAIKPNFLHPDPGPGKGDGGYALFVGRLSAEKGLETLLKAWEKLPQPFPLKIAGDGPLSDLVQEAAARHPQITWLGRQSAGEVAQLVGEATFLIVPSLWYEGFPRTILESFARGTPVIASRLGSMAEIVEHERTGWLFTAGNTDELVNVLRHVLQQPEILASIRENCRDEYLSSYTADQNYITLIDIYRRACEVRDSRMEVVV